MPQALSLPAALFGLLACQLAGEVLKSVFALPIPGPVLGMAILTAVIALRDRNKTDAQAARPGQLARVSALVAEPRGEPAPEAASPTACTCAACAPKLAIQSAKRKRRLAPINSCHSPLAWPMSAGAHAHKAAMAGLAWSMNCWHRFLMALPAPYKVREPPVLLPTKPCSGSPAR